MPELTVHRRKKKLFSPFLSLWIPPPHLPFQAYETYLLLYLPYIIAPPCCPILEFVHTTPLRHADDDPNKRKNENRNEIGQPAEARQGMAWRGAVGHETEGICRLPCGFSTRRVALRCLCHWRTGRGVLVVWKEGRSSSDRASNGGISPNTGRKYGHRTSIANRAYWQACRPPTVSAFADEPWLA